MKKDKSHTDDEIRIMILEFLNQKRQKARSLKSIMATVTDIKKGLKESGVAQNEVVTNLDFLVQNNWIKEEIDDSKYMTPRGFAVSSGTRRYKLADAGMRYLEGDSVFDRSSTFAGINVENIGGVVVVGNNNAVRTEFLETFRLLDKLESEVKITEKIDDEKKLSTVSEIRTIKDQLSKIKPDPATIKRALSAISFLGSIDGLLNLYQKIEPHLQNITK